jgi:hypothetical protein
VLPAMDIAVMGTEHHCVTDISIASFYCRGMGRCKWRMTLAGARRSTRCQPCSYQAMAHLYWNQSLHGLACYAFLM